jgi:hypothetical protein
MADGVDGEGVGGAGARQREPGHLPVLALLPRPEESQQGPPLQQRRQSGNYSSHKLGVCHPAQGKTKL